MAYTDLVCIGDRLIATSRDKDSGAPTVSSYLVVSRTNAKQIATGKMFKLNRRGNDAALFVGTNKVVGRS